MGIRDDNPPIMDNIIPVQPSIDMKLFNLNPKAYFDNFKSLHSTLDSKSAFSVCNDIFIVMIQ